MHSKLAVVIIVVSILLSACSPSVEFSEAGPVAKIQDFETIVGDWQGTLTYSDYSSGKQVIIKSNAMVSRVSENQIEYTVSYPDEPWEDTQAVVKLSEGGRLLDGHVVTNRSVVEQGEILLTTMHLGEDDNRPADIRLTYSLSPTDFKIQKDVRFSGSQDFLFRNVYAFARPN